MTEILTLEETKRLILEVIEGAGEAVPEDALVAAVQELEHMIIGGALAEMWRTGRLQANGLSDEGELLWAHQESP
jgi:hypothetical protein